MSTTPAIDLPRTTAMAKAVASLKMDDLGNRDVKTRGSLPKDELGTEMSVDDRAYSLEDDRRDMRRLGKKQELQRRFKAFTISGYIVVLGGTWEFALATSVFSLNNGGTAGAIWLSLVVCIGMLMTTLSFAEVASMAPTAGGQYHWVSEFSPPRYQKQLSYVIGWLCALGWQTGLPSVSFIGAQQVVALIAVCKDDYQYQGYHGALLTIAFASCAIVFNTIFISKLPYLEVVAVVLHVCGFVVVIAIFWAMGPRNDPDIVFSQFDDANGWGSLGLATLLAMVGPVSTFIGADSAVHLAEELKNASYVLPRAMVAGSLVNYILGFVTTVTLMSNLDNVEEAFQSSTGQPWVAIFLGITGSRAATIVLLVLMIVMFFFAAVNAVTTVSRQIWSFARDKGLPFHRFLSKVQPSTGVPLNAVAVSMIITCLVSLIIIGSTLAFNIILSVSAAGILTSYVVVIGCVLLKKLRREKMPATKFDLGHSGIAINVAAVLFCTVATFFLFWPAAPDPTPASMNWVVLIYGVVLIFAVAWYYLRGRFEYEGPVVYVRNDVT